MSGHTRGKVNSVQRLRTDLILFSDPADTATDEDKEARRAAIRAKLRFVWWHWTVGNISQSLERQSWGQRPAETSHKLPGSIFNQDQSITNQEWSITNQEWSAVNQDQSIINQDMWTIKQLVMTMSEARWDERALAAVNKKNPERRSGSSSRKEIKREPAGGVRE